MNKSSCHLGNKQSCESWTLKWVQVKGSYRDPKRRRCVPPVRRPVPRLQAGLGRAKVRRLGHPCTREKVRPGEPGSGLGRCCLGSRFPGECPRHPRPPHPATRQPARPPGARPRPGAAARVTVQSRAHLGPSERLRGSCTRRSGSGSRVRGSRAGIRLTEDEEDLRGARPVPRWPPHRPAATSPPRPATPLGRPPPRCPTPTQNWPGCTAAHVVLSPPPGPAAIKAFHVAEVAS